MLRIFRSVLCYFSFMASYAFIAWNINRTFFSGIDERVVRIICLIALVFTLPSVMQAFALYDVDERERFLAENKNSFSFMQEALAVMRSSGFIMECAVFFAFIAALPMLKFNLGYTNITGVLFFGQSLTRLQQKFAVCAVMFPLVLISGIAVRIFSRKDWLASKTSAQKAPGFFKGNLFTGLRLLAVTFIYALGFAVFPLYIFNAPAALMVLGVILPPLLAVMLALWLFSYISAFSARKKFIRNLKALCRENGFALSEIKKPYSFIFAAQKGFNFTVSAHGKVYDCKFLSGIHKKSPVMFDVFGAGVWLHYFRIRGKELFKYVHRFEYAFDGKNTKILILSPAPKEIYLGENNSRRRIDTGETIGSYKLFNEKGFLRSLELDVIEAKGRLE